MLGAFIKAVNAERGANYVVVARPDEVERTRQEVDYILRDNAKPPEIAAEVSSTWRSDVAGKEDADWGVWVGAVRDRVRGQLRAGFRLSTPMRIPAGLSPNEFSEALIDVLGREQQSLEQLHRSGKGAGFTVSGRQVRLSYARPGSEHVRSMSRLSTSSSITKTCNRATRCGECLKDFSRSIAVFGFIEPLVRGAAGAPCPRRRESALNPH